MTKKTTRRKFIFASVAAAGGIVGSAAFQQQSVKAPLAAKNKTMPERILGKTGISVPILGLGGAGKTPLSRQGQEKESIAIVEKALSLGIRYFDTAASYGPSEAHLGKILPDYRTGISIASKTAARDRDGAWRDLENSLQRLQTDYLDFWQLHHVSFHEELEQIFSSQGAIQAIEEARSQKLIKFSGITGHHEPDVIATALNRYPFDTTLVSINAADKHHPRPFSPTVLPVAKEKNVGVIAMKIPAYGNLFKPGVLQGMHQAMGYTLSIDGVHCCIIAAETPEQLEGNIAVAQAYQPLSSTEMTEIEQLTANVWEDNSFFRQWT